MSCKLCPFDKQPCLRDTCAIYHEEKKCCSLLLIGDVQSKTSADERKRVYKDHKEEGSRYHVHLFD